MSTAASSQHTRSIPLRIIGPLLFYFACAGIATVMLGPLLPELIARWHIRDAQAGALFTSLFAGQLTGSWVASRNLRASVIGGAAFTAAGCIAIRWADFDTAHLALFCIGLGLGAGLTAGNVITGTAVSTGRARALAILNTGWSIGAIFCPTLLRVCGLSRFFFFTGSLLALTSVLAAIFLPHTNTRPANHDTTSCMPLPALPLLLFAVALLLYVGIENTLGGWLPSYAVRNNPQLLAPSISLAFWSAELLGRFIMAAAASFVGEVILYRSSLALLIASIALLVILQIHGSGPILLLTILCGLTIAPLYPIIVASLLERTGTHPRLGPLFSSASLGGATLPWLTGAISTQFHGLRAGLIVPATAAAILLCISSTVVVAPTTNNSQSRKESTETTDLC